MNNLVIPRCPNWFKAQISVCAPDDTLIYGAKDTLVVIKDNCDKEQPLNIRLIPKVHSIIISVDINRKWGAPNKFAVTTGEEEVVSVWDLNTLELKSSYSGFHNKSPIIGAVFGGDDRIICVSEDGYIVIWNIHTNEKNVLAKVLESIHSKVTCISSCPYAGWMIALGFQNGLVVLVDVRRNGHIMHKMSGHSKGVVSLAWCPAPVNIFPAKPQNSVKNKTESPTSEVTNRIEKESGDFLKECQDLRNLILGLDSVEENKVDVVREILESVVENLPSEKAPERRVEDEIQEGRELPTIFDPSDNIFSTKSDEEEAEKSSESVDKPLKSAKRSTESVENSAKFAEKPTESQENTTQFVEKPLESEEKSAELTEATTESVEKSAESLEVKWSESEEVCRDLVEGVFDKVIFLTRTVQLVAQEEEPRKEYLLASAGKDRRIFIWRGGTDGRLQTFFPLPRQKKNPQKPAPYWVTLCWLAPETLVSTSGLSDYYIWTLPPPKQQNENCKIVKHHHSIVFNALGPISYRTENNWKDKLNLNVWSWSKEGLLLHENVNGEALLKTSTLTATVSCISASSVDPNKIALGLKSGCIKMWDLSRPNIKEVNLLAHRNFHGLIMSLNWHPSIENKLAFANEEGRVGVYELSSNKTKLLPSTTRHNVYHVEWGPIQGDVNDLGLYAVSDGKVFIYSINSKESHEPHTVAVPEDDFIYNFTWKPDFSILLLNARDGSLLVYSKELDFITRLYLNDKPFSKIVWHPDANNSDSQKFPYCNYLAAGSTKGFLTYDCSNFNAETDEKKYSALNIFSKPVLGLAWSPFDGNKLATSLEKGVIHVWDILTKTIISTYVDCYQNEYWAILWSPIDPDAIIVGEQILFVWKVSEHPPRAEDIDEKLEENKMVAEAAAVKPQKRIRKKTKKSSQEKDKENFLPRLYSSNEQNLDFQIENWKRIKSHEFAGSNRLFGTVENVSELLSEEQKTHRRNKKYTQYNMVSLWKGDIGVTITEAIQENRVTPFLLNLAPMVSPKLWQEACESYAKTSAEDPDSDPLEAAAYFLACHKIHEAIDILCATWNFQEALCVAKCRLPGDDEAVATILHKWGRMCINQGNFETAATCFITLGEYAKAAQVLARRNNEKLLKFAAELAKEAGNEELKNSILLKAATITTTIKNQEDPISGDGDGDGNLFKENVGLAGVHLFDKTGKALTRAEVFLKRAQVEQVEEKEEEDEVD